MQIVEPRKAVRQDCIATTSDMIFGKIFAVLTAEYIIIFAAASDKAGCVTTDDIVH